MKFSGYVRPGGDVGIRNYVLVAPGGLISEKICAFVPGTITFAFAKSGGGMTRRDREAIARTFTGFGLNPNVAGVIFHNGHAGEGYDELNTQRLADEVARSGKPVEILDVAAEGGSLEAITKGITMARRMVYEASRLRREPVDIRHLFLAVKCGASDPTSGLAGNPVVGRLFDHVVEAGGTAMFGETTEIIGAEEILAQRAVNSRVAEEIIRAARFIEQRVLTTGEDIRAMNPVPENIAAGISSLEEKSLGAIYKAGSKPIQGVLKYAQRPGSQGLYFTDSWMGPNSLLPGFAASGAQICIFQYGGGASARTVLDPSPAIVAPLLWASANPRTRDKAGESLDFYSGTVIEGKETIESAAERFFELVVDIASGTLTRGETVAYNAPIEVYGVDPLF
jgi:altronate dehydratase large subunit